MTYSPFHITDQEAAQFHPLPAVGRYRKVRLPSGRQAVLIRCQDSNQSRGWCWSLVPEKELEQPIRTHPATKGT